MSTVKVNGHTHFVNRLNGYASVPLVDLDTLEAERYVIGALLQGAADVGLTPLLFIHDGRRLLYEAVIYCRDRGVLVAPGPTQAERKAAILSNIERLSIAVEAEYAPDNSLVWVQRMGGDTSGALTDAGDALALDASGNVYVTGWYYGTSDFGATVLTTTGDGDRNAFVTKLNASGAIQWAKSWGTTTDDMGQGIGVDGSGNVYALGVTGGTLQSYDIKKFSSAGNAVWTKSISVNSGVEGDLAVNSSGNVYVTGSFRGTVDFDPSNKSKLAPYSLIAGDFRDAFLLRLGQV